MKTLHLKFHISFHVMNYYNIYRERAFPRSLFFITLFLTLTGFSEARESEILTGADRLLSEKKNLLQGKNIGLVTNHTAVFKNGTHLADSLSNLAPFTRLTTLYGPEHGIRGDASAGEKIDNSTDAKTGVPVFSLYGAHRKPTKEMLKNVNLLIFDIQDVGARFYTYISTLYYTIEAGAENNIPVIVLDRPNPIAFMGSFGPVRDTGLTSFVGIAPIPVAHGMSIGELAKYYAGELLKDKNPDLTVIEMKNYRYNAPLSVTTKNFVKPSPNIMTPETILLYPGTCLFEGTNLSEGRGTYSPFLLFGAPYLDNQTLLAELKKYGYEDISFEAVTFTPVEIENTVSKPKHKDLECKGIKIIPKQNLQSDPILLTLRILHHISKLHPDELTFRERSFAILSGKHDLQSRITKGEDPDHIYNSWKQELENFNNLKKGYLLYD